MTEALLPIVQKINGYLSDYILVALLIAVGLWYSIKTRFVQVRHFKEGLEQRVRQPQSPRRKAGERYEPFRRWPPRSRRRSAPAISSVRPARS